VSEGAPLIVDSLSDVEPTAGGWVFVRGTGKVYVEREGEWVAYVKPPTPNLWSILEEDA
jgi:hypothetical protein